MTRPGPIAHGSFAALLATAIGQAPPQDPEPAKTAAAQRFEQLMQEFRRASPTARAMSDAERTTFVGQAYRRHNEIAVGLVALAEQHPEDAVALDALLEAVWQVNGTPWPVDMIGPDAARARAFAQLQRDHLGSERLGALCERISYGLCQEYEPFLRAVLERSPHRPVQAVACLALARHLANRATRFELVREDPGARRQFEDLFGKDYVAAMLQRDRGASDREAETLFERASNSFADVAEAGGSTVGDRAKAGLFELRQLAVGKEAPDIDAEDEKGVRFKLSDYRGKVVLLDFWSEY